jgi:cell wall-associated NlpC family hydrolase
MRAPPDPGIRRDAAEHKLQILKQQKTRRLRAEKRLLLKKKRKRANRLVRVASTQIGVAYGWAMSSVGRAFDCSGFTLWVASKFGRALPHSAASQDGMLSDIPRENLEPGDLLFFSYGRLGYGIADHVEVYVGNGQSIGAGSSGIQRQLVDWGAFLRGGRFLPKLKRSAFSRKLPQHGGDHDEGASHQPGVFG